jgi:hypothetical protein
MTATLTLEKEPRNDLPTSAPPVAQPEPVGPNFDYLDCYYPDGLPLLGPGFEQPMGTSAARDPSQRQIEK